MIHALAVSSREKASGETQSLRAGRDFPRIESARRHQHDGTILLGQEGLPKIRTYDFKNRIAQVSARALKPQTHLCVFHIYFFGGNGGGGGGSGDGRLRGGTFSHSGCFGLFGISSSPCEAVVAMAAAAVHAALF